MGGAFRVSQSSLHNSQSGIRPQVILNATYYKVSPPASTVTLLCLAIFRPVTAIFNPNCCCCGYQEGKSRWRGDFYTSSISYSSEQLPYHMDCIFGFRCHLFMMDCLNQHAEQTKKCGHLFNFNDFNYNSIQVSYNQRGRRHVSDMAGQVQS